MSQPVVLITGAAGGIGSAIAQRFARGGWRLIVTDQDNLSLQRLQADLPQSAAAVSLVADLRTQAACAQMVSTGVAQTQRLECVVNAAGVWREGPTETMTQADVDMVLDVNLKGTFFVSAAAIPHLRRSQGSIINLSSDAGLQGNLGAAAYCASKGGVSLFTKALALELAPDGVRVNAICPGDVASPMLQFQADRYGAGDPNAYLQSLLAKYPQGPAARFIRPDEVAELAWFLAQPGSTAITGANLSIDFGISAGLR